MTAPLALLWVAAAATAQELPDEEPPAPQSDTRYIIVPDPFADQEEAADGAAGKAAETSRRTAPKVAREPSVPPRIVREVPRTIDGDAPDNLWGRYQVVEVTQAGLTEDFRNKMERSGRALNNDCIVTRQVFDFGPLPGGTDEGEGPSGHRPREVELTQIRQCDVGGLGKYAEEISMILPARWTEGDGSATLELPRVKVMADFVRLSPPRDGDMRTPPQWLAPDTSLANDAVSYVIVAERARRGTLPVLHLTTVDQVLHLEADRGDSPVDAAQASAGQP